MQTLLAAHEVVFFYRIPNLPQPESQSPWSDRRQHGVEALQTPSRSSP